MGTGLAYFESLQHLEGRKFSSIESARLLLGLLGNPQDAVPVIHVGGTNGKGSVCSILSAMFIASGKHVGQTSSPHLCSVTERCFIDGAPVDEASFGKAIDSIVRIAQENDLAPSYFVLGIAASFYEFSRRKLDWAVVEVGLGGRLDATNLVAEPVVSIITGISYDHTELLGTSLREIAWNKAGILRPGVPVFLGDMADEAENEIRRIAGERGCPVFALGKELLPSREDDALVYRLKLLGDYQKRNALLAVFVARHLGLSAEAIGAGIEAARWPGRLEFLSAVAFRGAAPRPVLLDVAHNVQGIEGLCRFLGECAETEICFVVSILSRKSWKEMIACLKELELRHRVRWIFTDSGGSGAVSPQELREEAGAGEAIADPATALAYAFAHSNPDELIVVTGSVYLVGKIRPLVTEIPVRTVEI